MSIGTEKIDEIKAKYKELCRELNMDKETEITSWKNYQNIAQNFMLEGDQNHWLCCSLYAACRGSFTPTVGSSSSVVRGNCVSLTKLLRSCNVSIYEFFTKMKNWIEMANMSKDFSNQIDRLERSFSTTYNIYNHYQSIFKKLFVISPVEKKNKKARPGRCSANKLYDLSWCLFLCAKNEDPQHTIVDLATAFHFLLCCMDAIFGNAVSENRVDLVNPSFKGVPKGWNTPEYEPNPTCIIKELCELYDAPYDLVRSMKLTLWKKIMKQLISSDTLMGDASTQMKIISNEHFEPNLKSLNNTYEQFVLSVGEFDERIFLTNASFRKTNNNDSDKEKQSHMNSSVRSLVPSTPLTRKHNLPPKDDSEPVACATKNVKKLQDVADKYTHVPDFIRQVSDIIEEKLEQRLSQAEEKFCEKFPTKSEGEKRFKLARSLYYYFLEKIIQVEIRTKPQLDLKVLLETDVFHTTVIACCLEIVLAAYNSYNSDELSFPWILDCLNLPAFHFYKIIEIVIARNEGVLPREIIKHLNWVEETCLESLVWRSNSPLWDAIKQMETPLPKWEDVDLKKPNQPIDMDKFNRMMIQSPMNSAYDYFNNQPAASNESARRDLFNAGKAETNDRQPVEAQKNITTEGRKKAGSLSLFFRKFYKLAWLRMRKLCQDINMDNDAYLNKIWTLFEYSIALKTELMHDRHLDQILMCAIYVYIKVAEIREKTFADIMMNYRNQPQAASNIYRETLIEPERKDGDKVIPAKFGDIISFYNAVYVQKMTPYALKFSDKEKSKNDLLLSPHPPARAQFPKKVSNSLHLYIQPFDKKDLILSPNNMSFDLSRSPAKDLNKLNEIIVKNGSKRNLPFSDDLPSVIHSKLLKPSQLHLHRIMKDRQGENLSK